MDRHELAQRVQVLPGHYADRLSAEDYDAINSPTQAGEWGEGLELLLLTLVQTYTPVSADERDELAALLRVTGTRDDQIAQLTITDTN